MAPPINGRLFAAIKAKLDVQDAAIYKRVAAHANNLGVRREIAALDVASKCGINLNRYASADELAELREARSAAAPASAYKTVSAPVRSAKKSKSTRRRPGKFVWIVHGRDDRLRRSMFDFVRSLGLQPLEWSSAVKATNSGAPYVGEVLAKAFSKASAVIVLMTPDDDAQLKRQHWQRNEEDYERRLTGQARPNVLFEAGISFGTHPSRTILVEIGKCRPFSDTVGRLIVRMNDSPQKRKDLADRLVAAGCEVDMSSNAWMEAGDFS